jgi:hypothetical protein
MWRGHEGLILSQEELERRASGRRHYNSLRHFKALLRRCQVATLLASGVSSRVDMAAQLGVHPSTILRDIIALLGAQAGACPTCGRPFVPAYDGWQRLESPMTAGDRR